MKKKKTLWIKSLSAKYALMFFITLATFLSVIFINYRFVTSEIKERTRSQMMFESFQQSRTFTNTIGQYTEALEFTANTLEKSIEMGASANALEYYFEDHTNNYREIIGGEFEGFYGLINGEDYISYERQPHRETDIAPAHSEWYKVALAAEGEIALSAPFRDENTGKIVITASKLLSDKKTVIATDLTLDNSKGDGLQGEKKDGGEKPEKPKEPQKDQEKSESTSFIFFAAGYIIKADDESALGMNIFDEGGFLGSEEDIKAALTNAIPQNITNEKTIEYNGDEYDINIRQLYDKIYIINAVNMKTSLAQQKKFAFYETAAVAAVLLLLVVLMYNIAKKNREAKRLDEEKKQAESASEAKSAFLSNMSHEIRTPINAVLGMNEMVLRECDDENILSYSESIKTAGNTLLGIINDILDFSKIEAGKMEIIPVDYDLSSVLNDLVNMVQARADDKGLILELEFSEDIPHYLNGDEIRIKQVITNILTNAVKYTKEGTITFKAGYSRIDDDNENILLNIAVKDTGIGIKQEDISKLFTEFERIEEERNRNIEGTGLGMNITRSLLDMMGSSLNVESTYGKGSQFGFSLKQRVVKWDPLGDYETTYRNSISAKKKYKETFTAPQAKVLVVDDTPMNLTVFKSLLKQTKIQIDTALSGDEGISAALENKYDIIFLDHMMPKKDGIQTLRDLRDEKENPNADTAMVCLTANAISGARETYISAGFDDYITKPIDPHKLEEMLINYLPKEKVAYSSAEAADEETFSSLPEFVYGIAEIDIQKGITNCGGEEIYLETLKTYAGMVDGIIGEIEKLYGEGDIPNTTIKIHALKSTSRIIGASDIGETAQMLENAGNKDDRQTIADNIGGFLQSCKKLSEQLGPLRERQDSMAETESGLPSIGDEEFAEACEMIKSLAIACDFSGISDVLGDLKVYSLSKEQMDKTALVQRAVDELDFENIPDILSR